MSLSVQAALIKYSQPSASSPFVNLTNYRWFGSIGCWIRGCRTCMERGLEHPQILVSMWEKGGVSWNQYLTRTTDLMVYKPQMFLSHCWGKITGSPRSGYKLGRVLVKTLFHVADFWLLSVSSHGGRQDGCLCSSFMGTVILFMGLWLSYWNSSKH